MKLFLSTLVLSLTPLALSFLPPAPLSSLRPTHLNAEEELVPGGRFLDEEAALAQSTFAIAPPALIELCKEALRKGAGVEDPSILAEDLEFCAPVVGPLGKEEYVKALKNFDLLAAFPDMDNRFHNIHVDPFELDRVWWSTRAVATHTGPLLGKPPSGVKLELPPQTNSFKFNTSGKIVEITVGYVLNRRSGNTGGLGGAFGYFYGVGQPLPIPECQPYKKSLRFQLLGLLGKLQR
mmetsp:Transcript_42948/g.86833  ORF Transcript_42948/g.86833 Transcript_42948/m.86833 type:complete len:236 (-) Transcript_42948:237-944(-)